ncbi:MAG TPA: hypothetical protein ENI61_05370 [Ignavibacteria bacterium]|nr:hypothetical protein [Ignavibacteria bacterium]
MVQANEPDAWTEKFLVTLQPKGGTAVNYYADIISYSGSGGDKDFTEVANGKGGYIKKFSPQTAFEITLEGYFTEVGNGKGVYDYFYSTTADSTQPLSFASDGTHELMLLSICQTTDTSMTSAISASAQDQRAIRDTYKNGHIVSVTESFTDNSRKTTIKFKVTPADKNASSNVTNESTDGSATSPLPVISYT